MITSGSIVRKVGLARSSTGRAESPGVPAAKTEVETADGSIMVVNDNDLATCYIHDPIK